MKLAIFGTIIVFAARINTINHEKQVRVFTLPNLFNNL